MEQLESIGNVIGGSGFISDPALSRRANFEAWVRRGFAHNPGMADRLMAQLAASDAERNAESLLTESERAKRKHESNILQLERLFPCLVNDSGIPTQYRAAMPGFDEYGESLTVCETYIDTTTGEVLPGNSKAIKRIELLVNAWKPRTGCKGLLFSSPNVGCGKTMLMSGMICAIMRKGYICRMTTISALLDSIKNSYQRRYDEGDPSSQTTEAIIRRFTETEILVLDDMGRESLKSDERGDWARNILIEIIDKLIDSKKTFCATSNKTDAELFDFYGERIMSRIMSRVCFTPINGIDYRVQRAQTDPFYEMES
jgi:DNA replication protein DnaC